MGKKKRISSLTQYFAAFEPKMLVAIALHLLLCLSFPCIFMPN